MSLPHALLGLLAVAPAQWLRADQGVRGRPRPATPGRPGTRASTPSWAGSPTHGLIEVTHEGARGSRTYAVTDGGPRRAADAGCSAANAAGARCATSRSCGCSCSPRWTPPTPAVPARVAARPRRRQRSAARSARRPGPVRPGPEGFGQLAAEYGLRQYEAVHEWAEWAIEQLETHASRSSSSSAS